jgi:hypothetical protein
MLQYPSIIHSPINHFLLSLLLELLLQVQQRIAAQVPEIQHIDQDYGQLQQDKPPISWPCALVALGPFQYHTIGKGYTLAEGTLDIILGFNPLGRTSQNTKSPHILKALHYYEVEEEVQKALQNWHPGPQFGPLTRQAAYGIDNDKGLKLRKITYAVTFEEPQALAQQTMKRLQCEVETQIE